MFLPKFGIKTLPYISDIVLQNPSQPPPFIIIEYFQDSSTFHGIYFLKMKKTCSLNKSVLISNCNTKFLQIKICQFH